jgi:hypothetical protein
MTPCPRTVAERLAGRCPHILDALPEPTGA